MSGDFYWIKKVGHHIVFAAADCTGHGVPGALMSMLGITFLNDLVNTREVPATDLVLNNLRRKVKRSLHHNSAGENLYDGLDIALCVLDTTTNNLQFSGANRPLYIIRPRAHQPAEEIYMQGNKMPVAAHIVEMPFTASTLQLQSGDCLYVFSDGYIDQFGGSQHRKFKIRQFKKMLNDIAHLPMCDQRQHIENTFTQWKKNEEQVDDVLVVGIRVQ